MFKISIHLCWSRSEKNQPHVSTVENSTAPPTVKYPTTDLSKSSNSQDHLFWAWRHPHSSFHILSGGGVIMTNGDCHILFARAYDCTIGFCTWTREFGEFEYSWYFLTLMSIFPLSEGVWKRRTWWCMWKGIGNPLTSVGDLSGPNLSPTLFASLTYAQNKSLD